MAEYTEALADFTRSIELYPQESVFIDRANVYRKMGKIDLAEADERRARELKDQ